MRTLAEAEAELRRGAGDQSVMRRQEACCLALGAVAGPILELHSRTAPMKKVSVDFNRVQAVVLHAVSEASRSPQALVQLRGIWLVTRYVDFFEKPTILHIAQG